MNNEVILMLSPNPIERSGNPIYQKEFNNYFLLSEKSLPPPNSLEPLQPYKTSSSSFKIILNINDNTPYTGKIKLIYPSHKTFAEYTYVNGQQYGQQFLYYENGNLQALNNLENGLPEGIQYSYYESGKKYLERTYRNGVQDGRTVYYYENGNKRE